ncbi:hypothetical protein BC829DRAFT_491285 [Chytridium lagenaria]|nr:hypothetical protein BC829DRAFT_491285 [Chytridium lagenaria]
MISITKLTMMKAMFALAYIASTCSVQGIPIGDAHQLEKRGYPRPPKASTVIVTSVFPTATVRLLLPIFRLSNQQRHHTHRNGSWTLWLACSSPSLWLTNQKHHTHRNGSWTLWLACSSPSLWLTNQNITLTASTAPHPSGSPAPPRPSGSPNQ